MSVRPMKQRRTSLGFFVTIGALVVAAGFAFGHQRREQATLRAEIELARSEVADVDALRRENQRLRENQIPAAELERLRADHAALPRLRAELEELGKRASR